MSLAELPTALHDRRYPVMCRDRGIRGYDLCAVAGCPWRASHCGAPFSICDLHAGRYYARRAAAKRRGESYSLDEFLMEPGSRRRGDGGLHA
jgi:hypothetical protein